MGESRQVRRRQGGVAFHKASVAADISFRGTGRIADKFVDEILGHCLLLLAGGALVYAWFYFIKPPVGRAFWDARRIKLPVFGHIAHKICLARFARTMASLVRSGVPILEVLAIVQNTVGNVVMEVAIKNAATDIERGEGISAALSKHPVFPTMIIRMMTAGEQTGKIVVTA